MKKIYQSIFLLTFILFGCQSETSLKVMQLNIWGETTQVPNGFEGLVDEIYTIQPDLLTLSEVRNYHGTNFMERLVNALKEKQLVYYADSSVSTGILSKYPIEQQNYVYPYGDDHGSVLKAVINIKGRRFVLYSAHLDYLNYACLLPRGYDPNKFSKMDHIVTNSDSIIICNGVSERDEAIKATIKDAQDEIKKESIIFIGGDFNEPSHLDWTKETANLFDHNGAIIPWNCSTLLEKAGFKDSYRESYPDPIEYPGFTFPANNMTVNVKKLVWAPEADERDRIDYIYFYPSKELNIENTFICGPKGTIIKGERIESITNDSIIPPVSVWPTDHNGIVATFTFK